MPIHQAPFFFNFVAHFLRHQRSYNFHRSVYRYIGELSVNRTITFWAISEQVHKQTNKYPILCMNIHKLETRFRISLWSLFFCVVMLCTGRYRSCNQLIPIASGWPTYCIIFLVGYLTTLSITKLHGIDMMMNKYETISGMRIGRGNQSTRRKPAPVPLCPSKISYDLTWDRTRRLTAWTMTRPHSINWLVIWKLILNQHRTVRDRWRTSHNPTHCQLFIMTGCYILFIYLRFIL
jgi:hypothetical protein